MSVRLLHCATLLAATMGAFPESAPAQERKLPPIPIDTFTLDNGLRVIVSEDHSAPVVAVNMWYHVGSAHEGPKRSGFAHLFEHLFFERTENLSPGELDRLITQAGGSYNGNTDTDRTAYYEVLPANRVNLALWLHAERMARLVVSDRTFSTQREVVKEERRSSIDNQPYGLAQLTLDTLAADYRPYKHPVIGSMEDLDSASTADVEAFYRRHYVPNNAVLAIVGDVTTERIRPMVEEFLGGIPRGEEVAPLPELPAVPRTGGERRAEVEDALAQLPLVWIAYNIPPAKHPDSYALSILSSVFSGGESSRLHRRLVQETGAAPTVLSLLSRRLGPGLFLFGSLPNEGRSIEEIEGLIGEEIEKLKEGGITRRELDKAKNQRLASEVGSRLRVQTKADALQWFQLHYGDPFRINEDVRRFGEVSLDDVRRVARTYLTDANRTVVTAVPARDRR